MMKSCVFPFLGIKTKCSQRYIYIHSRGWTGVLVESSVIRELRLCKTLMIVQVHWLKALLP